MGKLRSASTLSLIATFSCILLPAQFSVAQEEASSEKIAQAIRELASDRFEVRERATDELWKAGDAAKQALQVAATARDPETRLRAGYLLGRLRWGIRPSTPAPVREMIETLRSGKGDAAAELDALNNLVQHRELAWPALHEYGARTTNRETQLRAIVLLQEQLPWMLESGDFQAAKRAVDLSMLRSESANVVDGTVYAYLFGEVPQQIEALKRQYDEHPTNALAIRLVYMLRAADRLDEAVKVAEAMDRENREYEVGTLCQGLHLERGDWERSVAALDRCYAALNADPGGPYSSSMEDIDTPARILALFGNDKEFRERLERLFVRLYKERKGYRLAVYVDSPACALALAGNVDEAIDVFKQNDHRQKVFEILTGQERFSEALRFARDVSETDERLRFQFDQSVATEVARLGEHERAKQMLKPYVAKLLRNPDLKEIGPVVHDSNAFSIEDANRKPDLEEMRSAVSTCSAIGMRAEAKQLAVAGLSTRRDGAELTILRAMYRRSDDAELWWAGIRSLHPEEPVADSLDRLIALMDNEGDPDDRRATLDAAISTRPWDHGALNRLSDGCLKAGRRDEVAQIYESIRQYSEAKGHHFWQANRLNLAQSLLEEGRPKESYRLLECANRRDDGVRENLLPMSHFLMGTALIQANEKERGEQHIFAAELMFVGKNGDHYRYEFADELDKRGFRSAAYRQYEVIRRTSIGAWQGSRLMRLLALDAYSRREYATALNYYGQYLVSDYADWGTTADTYLHQPHLYRLMRVQVHLSTHQFADALKEAQICQRYLPGDCRVIEAAYSTLAKNGFGREAIQLFDRAYAFNRKICTDFPKSARHHALVARLAGACHLELDEGLVHGRRAVELAPDSAECLAALASVQFARQELVEANRLIDQCLVLDTQEPRYQELKRRFAEALSPNEGKAVEVE